MKYVKCIGNKEKRAKGWAEHVEIGSFSPFVCVHPLSSEVITIRLVSGDHVGEVLHVDANQFIFENPVFSPERELKQASDFHARMNKLEYHIGGTYGEDLNSNLNLYKTLIDNC